MQINANIRKTELRPLSHKYFIHDFFNRAGLINSIDRPVNGGTRAAGDKGRNDMTRTTKRCGLTMESGSQCAVSRGSSRSCGCCRMAQDSGCTAYATRRACCATGNCSPGGVGGQHARGGERPARRVSARFGAAHVAVCVPLGMVPIRRPLTYRWRLPTRQRHSCQARARTPARRGADALWA